MANIPVRFYYTCNNNCVWYNYSCTILCLPLGKVTSTLNHVLFTQYHDNHYACMIYYISIAIYRTNTNSRMVMAVAIMTFD